MFVALLLLIFLYLPGHFLGRRLSRKGDTVSELALLRIGASTAIATPVLVALALASWFTLPAILGSLGLCSVGAWFIGRGGEVHVRRSRWDLAALGLVAGSFALYARPAEYIINSRDPGVYTVVADRLARTGEFLKRDPLVGAVSSFHPFVEGIKYPGFYIYDLDLIVPQFFPGPFAWLGFGNLAGGLWGSLYVVPVFGTLAVVAAFFLGREVFGRWAGLVGAVLLAVGYTQVWWSREPSSEVMTQFFALAGLWLAVRFARGAGRTSGVLAGLLLGGAMLVRVDGFLVAVAIPLLFAYDPITHGPARRWLFPGIPLTFFAGAALLYLNTLGGRYLYTIYSAHGLDRFLSLLPYLLAVTALAAGAFWYIRRQWGARLRSWLAAHGGELALAVALAVAGAALWAYFVLPVPWEELPVSSRDFDAYRTQTLVRMVWFTTPLVAALGLAGFLLAAYRLDAPKALLLGAFLASGALYTAIPNVAPDLPWATRRFVPAAFPLIALLAGYAVVEAGRSLERIWDRRAGAAVAGALAVAAFGWTAYTALPAAGARELDGAISAFERVDAAIPEAGVVYVEKPDGHDGSVSTLEYVYGHPALPYSEERFLREVDELEKAGLLEDAVYITTDGGPAPLISGVEFREVGREAVSLPRLDGKEGHEKGVPEGTENLEMTFRIYRVEEVDR
ncbi:MAG: glycosyltransferase family 39 protein [Actinomycetota bacterium]|nr:glycosyltransferase family 39 protein [Actinomycetota bacterium]